MKYILMHKERPVLEMELDEITGGISEIGRLYEPERVPVGIAAAKGIVDRADLNHWWRSRSIPASRSGIRDALEHLGFATTQMLLSKCFGLSLSDQYWVKPENQALRWGISTFLRTRSRRTSATSCSACVPRGKPSTCCRRTIPRTDC